MHNSIPIYCGLKIDLISWILQEMIKAVALSLGREVKVYVSPAAIQGDDTTASPRPSQGNSYTSIIELSLLA